MNTIENYRKLNSYLIKNNIPFHTFVAKEEYKIKAVIKGIPIEIETEVKDDLEKQGYPVTAVHRIHCRDGSTLVRASTKYLTRAAGGESFRSSAPAVNQWERRFPWAKP
ncbi:hypothetical protein EVAR_84496_1 [Eumeta japonica]|uniref:Pre-C2HC domain-containing protein n=1 Tax=Eumeta variegata TaxID=151549 RepID=A0A4C1UHN9_EUMVA|nr:hypothetical protein EVAR_84496_1 [Eumeta japonica]